MAIGGCAEPEASYDCRGTRWNAYNGVTREEFILRLSSDAKRYCYGDQCEPLQKVRATDNSAKSLVLDEFSTKGISGYRVFDRETLIVHSVVNFDVGGPPDLMGASCVNK